MLAGAECAHFGKKLPRRYTLFFQTTTMSPRRLPTALMEAARVVRKLAADKKKSAWRILIHRIRKEWFAAPDDFDKRFGVETRLMVWRKRLSDKADSTDYEAVSSNLFHRAIACVPRNTFIDLGCGKGRALILAHHAGFRDLIGVEISAALVRAAVRNTRRLGIPATILEADAALFEFPDRPLVLFMYNPFGPPTIQPIIEKLRSHRHSIYVIYINPRHASLFSDFHEIYADSALAVISNRPQAQKVELQTGT